MGKLIYGASVREIEVDDRTLAHVKVAIITKLRRSESFALSFEHGLEQGSGRTTLWIHESIPLQFVFNTARRPDLNRAWIEALMLSANTVGGLQMLPEPEETGGAEDDEA